MPQNKNKFKRIGILCSGGNAPGMANCINIFTKKCLFSGITPISFSNGFIGLHDNKYKILNPKNTQLFIADGSALIGTSRCPQFVSNLSYRKKCVENLKKLKIDALFIIGGEGSFKGANELAKLGVKVIAIPATIDNDVACTDYTIGYDTCLNNICDVVSKITDVFISHQGVAIIELMGRNCPDLTIRSGIANNVTYMVTKYSIISQNEFVKIVKDNFARGKFNVIFLVTENIYGKNGYKSLKEIAAYVQKQTGLMTRHIEVGYMQRGGIPSSRDRLFANYMINIGMIALLNGRYNRAICQKNRNTIDIDLTMALKAKRKSWNKTLVEQFNKINQQ